MKFKIFGTEPSLIIGALAAIVPIIGTLGFHWLTGPQATLWVGVIIALFGALNALLVRPVSVAAFSYAAAAIFALLAGYGYNLSSETVATINLALLPVLALFTRGQVESKDTAVTNKSQQFANDPVLDDGKSG